MGDWSELRPYPHVLGHLGGEKGARARVEVGRPAGLQRRRRSCRGEFSLRRAARMARDAAAYGPDVRPGRLRLAPSIRRCRAKTQSGAESFSGQRWSTQQRPTARNESD